MLSSANTFGRRGHRAQSGMSLVELMVGVTIGLLVVAAATMMVSTQLTENRKLILETQLQQDLRATADIITRELRRASYYSDTVSQIWYEGRDTPIVENLFGATTPVSGDDLTEMTFKYRRRSGDEGPYGFKLAGYEVQSKIGGEWQVLTDVRVMKVTGLDIDLSTPVVYQLPCPRLCQPGNTQTCWPELQMRTATISLTGQSATDVNITRTLTTRVRIRNDFTKFNGATVCPA